MLAMDHEHNHEEESCVPPGFRFHPTEEELVGYYLARKVAAQKIDLDIIQEVDLYRIEPWDLQERCGGGRGGRGARQVAEEEQSSSEWYFFSFKDRKYPSGTRTNRATAAGFWKATGRDKPVTSSRSRGVIGMRKTLVFYRGRAPSGRKTDWIIHEYRLQTNEHAPTQVRNCSLLPLLRSLLLENLALMIMVMDCRKKAGWCAGRSRSPPRARGRPTSCRHTPPRRASGATTTRGRGCTAKAAVTSITCRAPVALPELAASASRARTSSTHPRTCWTPSRVSSATSRS
ncbi:hypothetical protein ACQJBY_040682 [Aegilops geniculata]